MQEALGLPSSAGHTLGESVHACDPGAQGTEAEESGVQGRPWLHREFQDSLVCMRPCLKVEEKKKEQLDLVSACYVMSGQPALDPWVEATCLSQGTDTSRNEGLRDGDGGDAPGPSSSTGLRAVTPIS